MRQLEAARLHNSEEANTITAWQLIHQKNELLRCIMEVRGHSRCNATAVENFHPENDAALQLSLLKSVVQ